MTTLSATSHSREQSRRLPTRFPTVMGGIVSVLAGLATISESEAMVWTSYLGIEVPTGLPGGGATSYFEVQYDTTLFADPTKITGTDLLACIFGTPTDDSIYTDGFGNNLQHSTASSAAGSVGYLAFFGAPFLESFTIGGTTYAQDLDYDPSWVYFVAGGGGSAGATATPGSYASGIWTKANEGPVDRYVANGSYDHWVLSSFDLSFNPTFVPTLAPSAGDFAGATLITHLAVPEPTRGVLLSLGLVSLLIRRQRRS